VVEHLKLPWSEKLPSNTSEETSVAV